MRNLKRALSLTLASIMLLGMMVVGSSAAAGFPDVDENDNVEAIEVLQTIEVMVGDDRGFGPDRPVTRNEMAVVMGKLLNLNYNYYASSCPFTDVAEWARGWVGAAYANGIVSGRGEGIYDGEATVTAVEAASMMMRALGYFKYAEDYADGFQLVTVRQGSDIGIFNGVGSDGNTPMTRNQVAQMALNALRSNMVTFTGTPGLEVNGVKVGYQPEYTPRTGTDRKYDAISGLTTTLNTNNQYYIQLGEQLYDGDLRLEDDTDDFGRPARRWVYEGVEIGTYAKDELLRKEYTAKVTGRDLYDELGATIINNSDWDLYVSIDGDDADNPVLFDKSALTRANTDGVGATEKGVLTQIYVDNIEKEAYIAIINTYLAIASEDYDSKNEEVDLDVYAVSNTGDNRNPEYIKDRTADGIPVTVEDEDIDVSAVKEDDMFLVTMAKGKVQSMTAPEVLSGREISSFKVGSDVVSDGETYEYAHTAKYDSDVLQRYSNTNLKDNTYNIILDRYGYLIGIEQNEDPDQYVFLTGMEGNGSDLSTKNAEANVIFLDGRMETVTVAVKDSKLPASGPQMNTWCVYSVDSKGVYTLKQVGHADVSNWDVFQKDTNLTTKGTDDRKIDNKNVSLPAITGNAYGNDDTVYINVETDVIKAATDADGNNRGYYWHVIIDDVDSVTVGARNASLKVVDQTVTGSGEKQEATAGNTDGPKPIDAEIYALYDDDGYIIAAVTIGVDDGVNKTYAYIHSGSVKRERYDKANDEWTWVREAIVDGKIVDLTEVGGGTALSVLKDDLARGNWYEIKTDANGNVKSADFLDTKAYNASTNRQWIDAVSDVVAAVNGEDTVILQQEGMTKESVKLTLEGGTLYTDKFKSDKLGFSVAPDVKTVLCLSDGTGHKASHTNDGCFDDCDDVYTGRTGLDRAIKDLDSNFTGELNVVFDKGDAVVIILVDQTVDGNGGGDDDDDDPPPADVYSINIDDPTGVTVLVDKDATAAQKDELAALDAVIAAIRAKGFTVADGAATKSTNTWTIKATKGAIAQDYVWDTSSDFDTTAITVTVGSSSKLMAASATIASLGDGAYAKVSGSTTSNNGFKAKTTALVDGATYDIGYYEVAVANTGWTLSSMSGTGLVDDSANTSKYYAKTSVAVTAVMEQSTAAALPTTHVVTVTGGPTGTAGSVTRAGVVADASATPPVAEVKGQVTITFTVASADVNITAFSTAAP